MSNSLDPDQARRFIGPDLGPNCLHRLSAGDFVATSGERVKPELKLKTIVTLKIRIDKPDNAEWDLWSGSSLFTTHAVFRNINKQYN